MAFKRHFMENNARFVFLAVYYFGSTVLAFTNLFLKKRRSMLLSEAPLCTIASRSWVGALCFITLTFVSKALDYTCAITIHYASIITVA